MDRSPGDVTLQVFGKETQGTILAQDDSTLLLVDQGTLQLLQEAWHLQEPVLVQDHWCLVEQITQPCPLANEWLVDVAFEPYFQ